MPDDLQQQIQSLQAGLAGSPLARAAGVERPELPSLEGEWANRVLISSGGLPDWSNQEIPLAERTKSFVSTNLKAGRPWDEVAPDAQKHLGVDPQQIKGPYKLEEARNRAAEEDIPWVLAVGRHFPAAGTAGKILLEREYGIASRRIAAGAGRDKGQDGATYSDYDLVAQYERLQQIDRQRSLLGAAAQAAAELPALALETAAGGGALRGVKLAARGLKAQTAVEATTSAALGRGAANAFARGTADVLARTAASPLFYAEEAQKNLNEAAAQGKTALSDQVRAVGAAFAYGVAQNAIVGQIFKPASGSRLGAVLKKTPLGMFEQQAVDSVAGWTDVKTGYGAFGDLARGKTDEGLKAAVSQVVTFGALAGFHGKSPDRLMKAVAGAIDDMHADGATQAEAGAAVQAAVDRVKTVFEKNPQATPADVKEAVGDLAADDPIRKAAEVFAGAAAEPPAEAPPQKPREPPGEAKPAPPADPYAALDEAAVRALAREKGFPIKGNRETIIRGILARPSGRAVLDYAVRQKTAPPEAAKPPVEAPPEGTLPQKGATPGAEGAPGEGVTPPGEMANAPRGAHLGEPAGGEGYYRVPDYKPEGSNLEATRGELEGGMFQGKWFSKSKAANDSYLRGGKFQIEFDPSKLRGEAEGDFVEHRGQEVGLGGKAPMYMHPALRVIRFKGSETDPDFKGMAELADTWNHKRALSGIEPIALEPTEAATTGRPVETLGRIGPLKPPEAAGRPEPGGMRPPEPEPPSGPPATTDQGGSTAPPAPTPAPEPPKPPPAPPAKPKRAPEDIASDVRTGDLTIAQAAEEAGLTPRELHVVMEVAAGRKLDEIARDAEARGRGGRVVSKQQIDQVNAAALAKMGLAKADLREAIEQERVRRGLLNAERGRAGPGELSGVSDAKVDEAVVGRDTALRRAEDTLDELIARITKETEDAGPAGLPAEREAAFRRLLTRVGDTITRGVGLSKKESRRILQDADAGPEAAGAPAPGGAATGQPAPLRRGGPAQPGPVAAGPAAAAAEAAGGQGPGRPAAGGTEAAGDQLAGRIFADLPVPRQKPGESDYAYENRLRREAGAETLADYVRGYGGIDPRSVAEAGLDTALVKEGGGLWMVTRDDKGRTGRIGLDELADHLDRENILPGATPERVVEALQNHHTLDAGRWADYELQRRYYQEYLDEQARLARGGANESEVQENLSAGLRDGAAEEAAANGRADEAGAEPDEAAGLRAERDPGADAGFDFGAEPGGAGDRTGGLRADVEASRKALVKYGFVESDVKQYEREVAGQVGQPGENTADIIERATSLLDDRYEHAEGAPPVNERKMMADHLRKVAALAGAEAAAERPVAGRLTAAEAEDQVARDLLRGQEPRGTTAVPAPGRPGAPPQEASALQAAREGVKTAVRAVIDNWYELAGRSAPRTTQLAEGSGNTLARLSSAEEHAKRLAPVLAEEVLAPVREQAVREAAASGVAYQEVRFERLARRLMATGYEERLRHTREVRRRQSLELADEAYHLRGSDEPAARAKFNESLARAQEAREVRTVLGRDGTDLNSEADYQRSLASPEYKAFKARWQAGVAPVTERAYRDSQGLGDAEEIESLTQLPDFTFNAKAVRAGDAVPDGAAVVVPGAQGRLGNVRATRNPFSREFTGAAEGYDVDPRAVIVNSLSKSFRVAAKARMYRQFVADGIAAWAAPGARPPGEGWRKLPEVKPPPGTQEAQRGRGDLWVHPDAYGETVKALDLVDPYKKLPGAEKATNVALLALVEALTHAKNLGTFVFKPGVNPIEVLRNFRRVVAGDPEARRRIAELAELGATKPEGLESAEGAERTPLTANPLSWLKKGREYMSRALDTIDLTMRLTADRAFDALARRGTWGVKETEQNRRDFVNQLGLYHKRVQNDLVRALKQTGLGPFAVAAFNYTAQGFRQVAGLSPGVTAKRWKGDALMRAESFLKVALAASVAPVLNYLNWGRPDGDEKTPLGGLKVRDKDGRTGYIDLFTFTGVPRGLRSAGALAMIEGQRAGTPSGESAKRGREDVFHGLAHPFLGPYGSAGLSLLTGRNAIGMPVAPKAKPGDTVPNQVLLDTLYTLANVNPVLSALTGIDRPTQKSSSTEERAMRLLGPFGVKYRGSPPGRVIPERR